MGTKEFSIVHTKFSSNTNQEIIEYNKMGYDIIGAAFEVRNKAGRGLREKYYEAALAHEIKKIGYRIDRQVTIPAIYDGEVIDDSYLADIVVEDKIVIEVKAIKTMRDEECRQLMTYMKLSNFKLGYLINFGAPDFAIGNNSDPFPYQRGIYRFVNKL